MKIALMVATKSPDIYNYVHRSKGHIIPTTHRTKARFEVAAVMRPKLIEFADKFSETHNADGVLALVDVDTWEPSDASHGLFSGRFSSVEEARRGGKNLLSHRLANLLSNYERVREYMCDRGRSSMLMLPEVFEAQETRLIFEKVYSDAAHKKIGQVVEGYFSQVGKRKKPANFGRSGVRYFVDDKFWQYELCHERHSQAGAGGEHWSKCRLEKTYRFGVKIDPFSHFNVSHHRSDRFSGAIRSCHGERVQFRNERRLNIFPNGCVEK